MIKTVFRTAAILVPVVVLPACGTARMPTAPSRISLAGTVTAQDGARVSGATVRIVDGSTEKSTTTNSVGEYRIDDVVAGIANLNAVADGYEPVLTELYVDGTKPLNITLRTTLPWSKSGIGSAVFNMPTYITHVHITGASTAAQSRFSVRVGSCQLIDDVLGREAYRSTIDATYLVLEAGLLLPTNGVVQIVNSPDVAWSFTEDRTASGGTPCYLDE